MYIKPSSVISPVKEIKKVMVLSDEGEAGASIALLERDRDVVLATRTNGTTRCPLGSPKSSTGKPQWFIPPATMQESLLQELLAANAIEIRYHISQILKQDCGKPFQYVIETPITLAEANLIMYAIAEDRKQGGLIEIINTIDSRLCNSMLALYDGKYSFPVVVDPMPVPIK